MTRSHKIGWLVLAAALLFVVWKLPRLHGQGFGSFSHDQPFLAKDVSSSSTNPPGTVLRVWYVAGDLTTNGSVLTLPDRIGDYDLTNSANAAFWPHKTNNALNGLPLLVFNGTESTNYTLSGSNYMRCDFLTNEQPSEVAFLIFYDGDLPARPTAPNPAYQYDFYDGLDPNQRQDSIYNNAIGPNPGDSGVRALYAGVGKVFSTTQQATNTIRRWMVYNDVYSNGASAMYFNNVLITNTDAGTQGMHGLIIGAPQYLDNFPKISLAEMAIFGAVQSDANRSNLFYYFTNKYNLWSSTEPTNMGATVKAWWIANDYYTNGSQPTLPDHSGNGWTLTNQDAAAVSPYATNTTLNGNKIICFAGGQRILSVTLNVTQACEVVYCLASDGATSGRYHWYDATLSATHRISSYIESNARKAFSGSLLSSGYWKQGDFAIYDDIWNGASSQFRISDNITFVGNAGSEYENGFKLGQSVYDDGNATMRFAEMIIFSGTLTTEQRANVHTYLRNKYGL